MTTIQAALQQAKQRIGSALDAQLLLCRVLGVNQAHLFTYPEQAISAEQAQAYEILITRAAAHEPFAYIVGRRAFYDLDLLVTPDVLIPRPETELLLERALEWAKDHPAMQVVDVGTGSGALAIAFARHVPHATVHAVDMSEGALSVALQNADKYGLAERIQFHHGDLLEDFLGRSLKFDIVMANLPYIPTEVIDTLDSNVRDHEPRLALDGGADGLDLVRRLLSQVREVCSPHALILLEIGAEQGQATLEIAKSIQPTHAEVIKDYAQHDRIVEIRL